MDVFEVFPNGIVRGVWALGRFVKDTEIGKKFEAIGFYDVIVDEEAASAQDQSPSADGLDNGTLLYAKPTIMDGLSPEAMMTDYLWHNVITDQFFEIRRVGIGKNQETGIVEHVEFQLKQIEVESDE